jgi:pimeloyl-ACP methyl ester carboxylesterase
VRGDWSERCSRWAGIRSEQLDVQGQQAHVLRADGPTDDGLPQLLIHGLGGAAVNWIEVMGELAQHGPVVAPDLPGFGQTEPTQDGGAQVPDNAAFLQRLLDELGWAETTVHGNSMGGMLAVHLAGLLPDRVARLVLAAPALPTPRTAMHRIPAATLARFAPFALPGLGQLAMRMTHRLPAHHHWRQLARYIHADPDRIADEAAQVGFEDLVNGRSLPWRLAGFVSAAESLVRALLNPRELLRLIDDADLPVLLVWGDEDRLVGPSVIDHLVERRPDWDLEVLPSIGHLPMLEAPDEYLSAVTPWLEDDQTPTADLDEVPAAA